MSKKLNKLVDINGLREFKNKLVGTYVQTSAVDQTIAGTKTFSNGVLSTAVNAFMAQNKGYTALLRNDGGYTYLLISDKDGVPGTWSDARPLAISNSTGVCSINGNASTATTATTAKACTGNAATATKLATARTIALSGAATGTATAFDGSGNITIPVTSLDASKLTGTASVSTTGNAASANIATKATQDAAGNTITTTYVTKTEASKTYVTKTDAAKTYATKSEIIVHVGVIIPFAGKSVPTGYLLCNGAAVSRTNYANLFAAIGTLYGAGDGSTTFNLPDARDRVLQGASGTHSAGSYIAAGLPNITGYLGSSSGFLTANSSSGALHTHWENTFAVYVDTSQGRGCGYAFSFDASKSNALYGANSTVQPPAIAINFIIKY